MTSAERLWAVKRVNYLSIYGNVVEIQIYRFPGILTEYVDTLIPQFKKALKNAEEYNRTKQRSGRILALETKQLTRTARTRYAPLDSFME